MAPLDQAGEAAFHDDPLSALTGANAPYIAELFARYHENPQSVDANWQTFFASLSDNEAALLGDFQGPSWRARDTRIVGVADADAAAKAAEKGAAAAGPALDGEAAKRATQDSVSALMMIRAYRIRGHLIADLDPLGLKERLTHEELNPETYGFGAADMDREVYINNVLGLGEYATVQQILDRCRATYCGRIGVEFMHITDPAQKAWVQERIEAIENKTDFTEMGKKAILERLTHAEGFENFLDKKFPGTKRFGLDGGETMIPALEQILKRGSQLGLKEVVLGMAHRGRLNVLANFMQKPFRAILNEFLGGFAFPDDINASGDVKYHLGTSADREFDGETVHLSLNPNPSHLEAVNPVVVGKARAKQDRLADRDRTKVMPILIHGDAAFAGQGLVPEVLDLTGLKGYRTGGVINFVINNQIGFTTNPVNARPGPYCTDIAKAIEAPIFHVNGDDPEAVVHIARIATEFRQEFQQDVVIDMFCYRRFGHNEGDEPAFTQPLMYKQIKAQRPTRALYADKLAAEGLVPAEESQQMVSEFQALMAEEFEAAQSYKPNSADWLGGAWDGLKPAEKGPRRGKTGLSTEQFDALAKALPGIPEDFTPNSKVVRLMDAKRKMFDSGEGFDWATAEAMAFGSLLMEGAPIRFSGQDVRRGTFTQRHAVLTDQNTEATHTPLTTLSADQARLEIIDSPLSELGVLGFEYGYSTAEPKALTLWEAQFGDFSNGAQIIIDQFISSAEAKWLRMSGLVMLLPHGYEGQGPEHSSARLERYLQMCGEDNWQVANCTTPANYFHILRRQLRRDFRKPLVLMTPKSLLRHKRCVSSKADFMNGSTFHRVLLEDRSYDKKLQKAAKRVVLCSGKVYYDLLEAREAQGLDDVHLMRIEQLYPFPSIALSEELEAFKHCEFVWCQEEPKNMGAWTHVDPYIEDVLEQINAPAGRAGYAGRTAAASPATGSNSLHKKQQAALVEEALTGPIKRR